VRNFLPAAFVMAASLIVASSAHAAGGCGEGSHPGPHGRCHVNVAAPAARPEVVVAEHHAAIYAPPGRACPYGKHLGPQGRHCVPN
jgi:hypothetical protein